MTTVAVRAAALVDRHDEVSLYDWRDRHALHVACAVVGDWCDHAGRRHHGVIVTTRELGPIYQLHFDSAERVRVKGTVVRLAAALLAARRTGRGAR
ncbi:MAG TPA: hypothetical protein VFW64_12425 [Pseudonocardiaceae bacterium]|nr:hypothetical protein [Pseudonocardiaceae bacterium]